MGNILFCICVVYVVFIFLFVFVNWFAIQRSNNAIEEDSVVSNYLLFIFNFFCFVFDCKMGVNYYGCQISYIVIKTCMFLCKTFIKQCALLQYFLNVWFCVTVVSAFWWIYMFVSDAWGFGSLFCMYSV